MAPDTAPEPAPRSERCEKLVAAAKELQAALVEAGIKSNSDFTLEELNALLEVTSGDFQRVFGRIRRLRGYGHEGY